MKLTLFLLLATSAAFSQDTVRHRIDLKAQGWIVNTTPDTIRAILLVTLAPNGIAHARMGFVVRQPGKPVVYLDCRKRALKRPQVGWDWREVKTNYNK